MMKEKFVTIFGSSIPRAGEKEYEDAYRLAKKLSASGLNVCSGGFQGIMDAVSKGASENGAQAIGVTLKIYNAQPSKFLTKEIQAETLFERLKNLVEIGDAYIVLNGGTGTLLELALVWEYMNKMIIDEKPFVCHGQMWKQIVQLMDAQILREKRKNGLVKCFDTIDECADYVTESLI